MRDVPPSGHPDDQRRVGMPSAVLCDLSRRGYIDLPLTSIPAKQPPYALVHQLSPGWLPTQLKVAEGIRSTTQLGNGRRFLEHFPLLYTCFASTCGSKCDSGLRPVAGWRWLVISIQHLANPVSWQVRSKEIAA